jgi:hypothetical protein
MDCRVKPGNDTGWGLWEQESFDLDFGLLDDLFVFRHLVADVSGELFSARSDWIKSDSVQPRLHVRQCQYFGDVRLQLGGNIGGQVLGPHNPYQDTNAKPFMPDSATVGISGAAAARLRLVMPSALILPPCAGHSGKFRCPQLSTKPP